MFLLPLGQFEYQWNPTQWRKRERSASEMLQNHDNEIIFIGNYQLFEGQMSQHKYSYHDPIFGTYFDDQILMSRFLTRKYKVDNFMTKHICLNGITTNVAYMVAYWVVVYTLIPRPASCGYKFCQCIDL